MTSTDLRPSAAGYASILVPMEPGPDAENRIKLAASLADRFSSHLIGVAAHPLAVPLYFETPVAGIASAIELEERRAAEELAAAKAVFDRAIGTRNRVEWRQAQTFPVEFVLEQSRAADLIVATLPGRGGKTPHPMQVDAGDLVMGAGRPVLFAPRDKDHLSAKRVVVGWKDTREARRAVADALPLLRLAQETFVACVGTDEHGGKDVCAYLGRHGIAASCLTRPTSADAAGEELANIAVQNAADLVVSGAYGHSRAREWMFGGVTRDLLQHARICCLMAH